MLSCLFWGASICVAQVKTDADLYAQAAKAMLDREFPSPRIEYLLLDARTTRTIAERWGDLREPMPAGSLLKPFVALAYAESHADRFPVMRCEGKTDRCWRQEGHGPLGLERALAESCNAYFLALAHQVGRPEIERVSVAYGLPAPPVRNAAAWPTMLMGMTPEWRLTPEQLAHGYLRLMKDHMGTSQDQPIARIRTGMRIAAGRTGTASRLGAKDALAKTGTAPCVDGCVATGDGLVVVMTPADEPRLLLLVRKRGTTGAMAAEIAGLMLKRLQGVHVPAR